MADFTGIGSVADLAKSLLDKFVPDPAQKAQAALDILKLQQEGTFKEIDAKLAQDKAQTDINLEEAKSSSLFVAGWRPFIGWICGGALAYQFILRPLITFGFIVNGHPLVAPMPGLDDNLWQLLMGMLGLGAFRTYEKKNGVAK